VRRLLDVHRPGERAGPPQRARRHLRARLARAAGADRGAQAPDGLDHALDTIVGEEFQKACGTSEYFALDVFLRDHDRVFLTYATTGRGVEALGSVWTFLDLTPLGRQEEWEDTPAGRPQTPPYQWWRLHDSYE
jgi:hypothetical protein